MCKTIAMILVLILASVACTKNTNTPNDINQADRDFIFNASFANAGELNISTMADSVSTDSLVRDYAGMMVVDHTNIEQSFSAIASGFSYYSSDSLNAEYLALQQQLLTLSGREYDSVYIHSSVETHVNLIAFANDEIANGINPPLKNFATSILPTLQMHLKMADSLALKYK